MMHFPVHQFYFVLHTGQQVFEGQHKVEQIRVQE